MARYYKAIFIFVMFLIMFPINGQEQDLCARVDMKPVLSLEQIRMAELVDFVCELAGIKKLPSWPTDVQGMSPEEYYKMEVKMLIDNGFPPIFSDIEPERLVNRRFFASLMFQIAMEADPKVKEDCKNAVTETEQFECLLQHDWIYSKTGKIYREEILSVLCQKQDILKKLVPEIIKPIDIYSLTFNEGTIETPATPANRTE